MQQFYTYGGKSEFALGAMFAVYDDTSKSAEEIAKIGIKAVVECDDGTGWAITCYKLKLK